MTVQQLDSLPSPPNLDALQLTRERRRKKVNRFLRRHHPEGDVAGWRACFGARYANRLVAVVVVGRPSARLIDQDRVVEITRYARRDDRPDNTGTWLLARARQWAALEGYDRIISYAGVAGNRGDLYEGAGFEEDKDAQTRVNGDEWAKSREGRKKRDSYLRRKWVYELGGAERWSG